MRRRSGITNAELNRRLRLSCLIILVAGLLCALLIHHFAEDIPDDTHGYMVVNGAACPLWTRDSTGYRHELERFGGKTAVVFDDFNRWLTELSRGKTLGKTVAWISVLLSLRIHVFSASPPDRLPEDEDAPNRRESE